MEQIKILAIDDDKEILYALNAIFEFNGWISYMASNVQDALIMFKDIKPDIVLIDYHMPMINGVEGVRLLRKLDEVTPIIVFTIDEREDIANEFLEAGASDFALKPIKAPDIISRINVHMRLMRSTKKEGTAQPSAKGIRGETLELIREFLSKNEEFITVDEIAEGTGLAYQTTNRYIQYMVTSNMLVATNTYGKIGRPKQHYKLK